MNVNILSNKTVFGPTLCLLASLEKAYSLIISLLEVEQAKSAY